MIGKYALRFASLGYLAVLLVAPVGYVFWETFQHGFDPAWDAVTTPEAKHAFYTLADQHVLPLIQNAIDHAAEGRTAMSAALVQEKDENS